MLMELCKSLRYVRPCITDLGSGHRGSSLHVLPQAILRLPMQQGISGLSRHTVLPACSSLQMKSAPDSPPRLVVWWKSCAAEVLLPGSSLLRRASVVSLNDFLLNSWRARPLKCPINHSSSVQLCPMKEQVVYAYVRAVPCECINRRDLSVVSYTPSGAWSSTLNNQCVTSGSMFISLSLLP